MTAGTVRSQPGAGGVRVRRRRTFTARRRTASGTSTGRCTQRCGTSGLRRTSRAVNRPNSRWWARTARAPVRLQWVTAAVSSCRRQPSRRAAHVSRVSSPPPRPSTKGPYRSHSGRGIRRLQVAPWLGCVPCRVQLAELHEVLGGAPRARRCAVPDAAGDDEASTVGRRDEISEPAGRGEHVGVGEHEDVAGGFADAPVPRRRRIDALEVPTQVHTIVRGEVVGPRGTRGHDDDLVGAERVLGEDARHRGGEPDPARSAGISTETFGCRGGAGRPTSLSTLTTFPAAWRGLR